jgi:hypothetical protein
MYGRLLAMNLTVENVLRRDTIQIFNKTLTAYEIYFKEGFSGIYYDVREIKIEQINLMRFFVHFYINQKSQEDIFSEYFC